MALRWILAVVLACSCAGAKRDPGTGDDGSGDASSPADTCIAPDMLVLLDRTMSMSRRPDGSTPPNTTAGRQESKWYIALNAIESVTAYFNTSVRFGLALFPRDPSGGQCVTLAQRLSGTGASNNECQPGEVLVTPDADSAQMIASVLDPETTTLCRSTPIGAGLGTVKDALSTITDPSRKQYVLFLGDGNDTCQRSLVLQNLHALAEAGIRTFVVAFDGSGDGIDNGLLNDMACAGQTAPGFPAPCKADAAGNYTALDRSGPPLYLHAEDAAGLITSLTTIIDQICCGCVG